MTTPADDGDVDTPGQPRPRVRRAGNLLLAGAVVGLAAFGAISHSAGATHPAARGASASGPTPSGAPSPTAHPATTPRPSRSAAPVGTHDAAPTAAGCPSATDRGRSALQLLRSSDLLAGVHVTFAPGQAGVLSSTDVATKTVTAFVRDCSAEPLSQIAAAVVDQAMQLRVATTWTPQQQQHWVQLRGAGQWSQALQQDVGAVAVLWELGTTQWWRSPLPPPTTVTAQLAAALRG